MKYGDGKENFIKNLQFAKYLFNLYVNKIT